MAQKNSKAHPPNDAMNLDPLQRYDGRVIATLATTGESE